MQVYDNKSTRSPNSCSYCRQPGHNVTKCPHVSGDYASWQRMEVPLKDPDCWVLTANTRYGRAHWFKNPRYWGEWYDMAMNAHAKQEAEKQKAQSPRKRTGPRKCGFCGETGHTRRHCAEMLAFRQKAKRANQAIRRYIYDLLVTEHGLDVGALIEPVRRQYVYSSGEYKLVSHGICTITSINWDKISVTSDINGSLDWELETPIIVDWITPDGARGKSKININREIVGPPDERYSNHSYGGHSFIKQVISPSPTPLDEEWVENAREDAFDWLSNKRNLEWLRNKNLIELVDRWSARYEEPEQNDESR